MIKHLVTPEIEPSYKKLLKTETVRSEIRLKKTSRKFFLVL